LVVVASTYVRYIWAEEEKGFIRTVVGYELVDPKRVYKRIWTAPSSFVGPGQPGRAREGAGSEREYS
jgi:hypothetical protein